MFYLWLVLAALGELVGDILLKMYVRSGQRLLLIISLGLYFTGSGFWLWVLKDAELGKSIVAFTAVFLVAAVVAGFFMGEKVTPRLCAGLLLAVVSLWLVEGG